MANKTVHQISIEADASRTRAALVDVTKQIIALREKAVDASQEMTDADKRHLAVLEGKEREYNKLDRAYARQAKLTEEASESTDGLAKQFGGLSKGAVAAAAGLAALGSAAKMAFDAFLGGQQIITETTNLSASLGLTTEQFAGLKIQAESTGTSMDDLRGVFAVFQKEGINVYDGLKQTAEQLEGMADPAERAAYMVETFGESGAKLIPILKDGAAGIDAAAQLAKSYGLAVGEDAVEANNAYTAAMAELKAMTDGFKVALASELLPVITAFIKNLKSVEGTFGPVITTLKVGTYTVGYLFEALRTLVDFVSTAVIGNFVTLGRVVSAAFTGIKDNIAALGRLLVTGDIAGFFKDIFTSYKDNGSEAVGAVKDQFVAVKDTIDQSHTRMERLDQAFWDGAEGAAALNDALTGGMSVDLGYSPVTELEQKKALAKQQKEAEAAQAKIDAKRKQAADKHRREAAQARRQAEREGEEAAKSFLANIEERDKEEEAAAQKRLDDWVRIELFKLKQKIDIDNKIKELEEKRADEAKKRLEDEAREAAAVQSSMMSEIKSAASSAGSIIADGLFAPMEEGANRMEEMGRRLLQLLAELVIKSAAAFAVQAITGGAGGGIGGAIASAAGFASGGYVSGPGTSTSDSIPARLSNGEYVINAEAVDRHGKLFFDRLNGLMPASFANGGSAGGSEVIIVNPPTERAMEQYLSSNRGRRMILNAGRGVS